MSRSKLKDHNYLDAKLFAVVAACKFLHFVICLVDARWLMAITAFCVFFFSAVASYLSMKIYRMRRDAEKHSWYRNVLV